jgi:hypothetical protein
VDGLWRVAFVFFHTHPFGEAQTRIVHEIVTLTGTVQFYPLYPPSCSCD